MLSVQKNTSHLAFQQGFTIIELLIVMSVLVFLAIPASVSYVSYNKAQQLNNAALEIKTMLLTAQSRAQSVVAPPDQNSCNSNHALQNYEVHFCGSGATCQSGDDYDLYANCVGSAVVFITGEGRSLPTHSGITLSGAPSTVTFAVLSGAVTSSSPLPVTITLSNGTAQRNIIIQKNGVINTQ